MFKTTYDKNEIPSLTLNLTFNYFPPAGGGNCKAKKPKYGPADKIGTGMEKTCFVLIQNEHRLILLLPAHATS